MTTLTPQRVIAVSGGMLALLALASVLGPWLSSHAFDAQNLSRMLEGPSADHWLGTDKLGRDLWVRVLLGARLSLSIGVVTALVALALGTLTGAIAGFRGGLLDTVLMRVVDFFYTFPALLLSILVMVMMGRGVLGIFVALSLTSWVTQARLIRAQVLQTKGLLFVESARAVGASPLRVLWRHILPHLWGTSLVSLTLQIPNNILAESFLSFIGLGLEPPYASWGTLSAEGFQAMRSHPHLMAAPGVFLFVAILSFNFLGDALRDWLDPRSRKI